jgi:hypothetical protein
MYHCLTCKAWITAKEEQYNCGRCEDCYTASTKPHWSDMPNVQPTGNAPVSVKWSAEHGIQATSPNFENTVEGFLMRD